MFKKRKGILLIIVVFFLIIYPYSKEIKVFRAKDTNWDVLNYTKKYKEFDPRTFALIQTYNFTEEILSLDGKDITIVGFIKKDKHGKHTDILLTETVTDVCFMCDHDEHYNMLLLKPKNKDSNLFTAEDDILIKVKGKFKIDKSKNAHSVYSLEGAELDSINK
ncbi:MAG: hypothetical protein L3J35_12335 [Bacteroidales bacterium]|nr:hypothetical protein [Bacteroidales bacterium]